MEAELTEAQLEQLEKQNKRMVSYFEASKLEREAKKHWDKFYMRNTTNFFKDRHWTEREFPELASENLTIIELGCGVGNFIFPILEANKSASGFSCDFSPRAVDFVKKRAKDEGLEGRITAFTADLTLNDWLENVTEKVRVKTNCQIKNKCDLASLIFVLSAIHPDKHVIALKNISEILKPNGKLIFRDYAENDHAMLRFKPGTKVIYSSFYSIFIW